MTNQNQTTLNTICKHNNPVNNCIYCNPNYADVKINFCEQCDAFTWSKPIDKTNSYYCLRCEGLNNN